MSTIVFPTCIIVTVLLLNPRECTMYFDVTFQVLSSSSFSSQAVNLLCSSSSSFWTSFFKSLYVDIDISWSSLALSAALFVISSSLWLLRLASSADKTICRCLSMSLASLSLFSFTTANSFLSCSILMADCISGTLCWKKYIGKEKYMP